MEVVGLRMPLRGWRRGGNPKYKSELFWRPRAVQSTTHYQFLGGIEVEGFRVAVPRRVRQVETGMETGARER